MNQQESTSDLGGSSESLQSTSTAATNKPPVPNPPLLSFTIDEDQDQDDRHPAFGVKTSSSKSTLITVIESNDSQTSDANAAADEDAPSQPLIEASTSSYESIASSLSYALNKESHARQQISNSPPNKYRLRHPLEDMEDQGRHRMRSPSGDSCLVKSMSLPVEPMRNRALSTGHYPRNQDLENNVI